MISETAVLILGSRESLYVTRDETDREISVLRGPTDTVMDNLPEPEEYHEEWQIITLD